MAWLLLIGNEVFPFEGKPIAGLVAVLGTSYQKAGKWSSTTYRLALAPGVKYIQGVTGWETGTFAEGLAEATHVSHVDTWEELAGALGVPIPSAQRFLRAWRPQAAEALDELAERLRGLGGAL